MRIVRLHFLLLFLLCLFSCERKPLYLQGDIKLNINVNVEADVDALWDRNWRDQLLYNWDESYHGKIGYTSPDEVNIVFFNGNTLLSKQTIQTNKRSRIDIELNKTYDILIYNETDGITSSYDGGRYYVTSIETNPTFSNEISDKYTNVRQSGEIFSQRLSNIYLSDIYEDYESVYENGKIVYVYNIDATLKPVSYIYIIQFVIVNDDNSDVIEAREIKNISLSGISSRKNLLTGKAKYTGLIQVSTDDIKEGQLKGNDLLFATRVTVLDVNFEYENSSWNTQLDNRYYTVVNIETHNYGIVTGTIDITRQIKNNPYGGIVTVKIMNSDLKKGGETQAGFGIDIKEIYRKTIKRIY